MTLVGKHILLIVGGGIAGYKSLETVRRLRERGAIVSCVMTEAAQKFVTPLSFATLSGRRVFTDLFDQTDEHEIGHIRLSRQADLIVIAPATADLMAKLANGHANDLASAVLLATDKRVLMAPAMNPRMWANPAVARNRARLEADGIAFVGPEKGEMAETGEAGEGRMAEPLTIVAAAEQLLAVRLGPLVGRRIIVTSGPTHEPIDPVRYLGNRSSGRQGHAIAEALVKLGAEVRLISGPVAIADPVGARTVHVETAVEMWREVEAQLPADVGVFVAAVADWRQAKPFGEKLKKKLAGAPVLNLIENPDILANVGHHQNRPRLVIGFAAETQDVIANARAKLDTKGADFIVANDVSADTGLGATGVMGGDYNKVSVVSRDRVDEWPLMDKRDVARRLAEMIVNCLID